MKKFLLHFPIWAFAFCIQSVTAQSNLTADDTEVITCSEFKITRPLLELMNESQLLIQENEKKEMPDRDYRKNLYMLKINPNAAPPEEDPICQKEQGTRMMMPPLANWQGQSGSGIPPDPSGAAGPDHYMQAVNTTFRIYNKTGTAITSVANLGTLLFNVNNGDPIVMYDKFADRWFISQFGFSGNKIYIGISQTNDPTGSYYTYQFTSSQFPDYLKFSIWSDGYYMTANTNTQRVFAFERAQMILGNSGSRAISKTFTPPDGGGFFCPLTAYADGQLPPAGTPCPIFSYEDDGWGGSFQDRINIYKMAVNWVPTTPTATITLDSQLPVAAFDASYNASWNDIVQPGTTQKLDGIGGVLTFRAQWRMWTGYNSVVVCHATKANSSTGQFGIRWYELRQNSTSGVWSVFQQGTYAPDVLNRWVGSIAMDDNGSIGMAYAVSGVLGGNNVYPGLRYTGRLATDPPGTFTFAEEIAIAGTGYQTGTNRFGDYSHTALDPDGITFWHTGEYIFANGNSGQRTRIFSFQLPIPTSLTENHLPAASYDAWQDGTFLHFRAKNLAATGTYVIDLFTIEGKKVDGKVMADFDKQLTGSFDTGLLSAGTYLVRFGLPNSSFQKVIKVTVQR